MKHLLLTTIAAVVLVGCGPSVPDISIREAVNTGNIEAVKQHLDAGADVNAEGDDGFTPLGAATMEGHKEIAELLIAKGADVTKGGEGSTPLHSAAKEVVELLIAKGAEVNARIVSGPIQGSTPLDLAIINRETETADLLRKHGGKTGDWFKAEESIQIAVRAGHIEAVKKHLAAGTDVNAKQDGLFRTLLHLATRNGLKEVAELLIEKGATVNA